MFFSSYVSDYRSFEEESKRQLPNLRVYQLPNLRVFISFPTYACLSQFDFCRPF